MVCDVQRWEYGYYAENAETARQFSRTQAVHQGSTKSTVTHATNLSQLQHFNPPEHLRNYFM